MVKGADKLVGTWKLLSVASVSASGVRNEAPYGPNPVGFLTYGDDGRVSALISYDGRKPFTVGASPSQLLEEQAEAFRSFLAYAGRYRLDGDKVIHFVEASSVQNWVNTELVRRVTFHGDRIVLVTPPTRSAGKMQTFELSWQRLGSGS